MERRDSARITKKNDDLSRPKMKNLQQRKKRKQSKSGSVKAGPDPGSARGAFLPGARLQGCKNGSVQGHEISP